MIHNTQSLNRHTTVITIDIEGGSCRYIIASVIDAPHLRRRRKHYDITRLPC